jgi:hypothetical protein
LATVVYGIVTDKLTREKPDEYFRVSDCMRSKWDEYKDNKIYVEPTVRKCPIGQKFLERYD